MSNSSPYRIPFLSAALSLRFRFCFPRWLIIPARSILWHLQGLFWKSVLNACVWLMPWVSVKKTAHLLQWRWVTRDMDRPPWSWRSLRSHPHFAHFLPSFFPLACTEHPQLTNHGGDVGCSLTVCAVLSHLRSRGKGTICGSALWFMKLLDNYGASLWSIKFTKYFRRDFLLLLLNQGLIHYGKKF